MKREEEMSSDATCLLRVTKDGSLSLQRNEVPEVLAQAGISLSTWMVIYDRYQTLKDHVMEARTFAEKCNHEVSEYWISNVALKEHPMLPLEQGYGCKIFKLVMAIQQFTTQQH